MTKFCSESGKYGFKNSIGDVVIDPVYDLAEDFSEGLAAVNIGYRTGEDPHGYMLFFVENPGYWGFINEKGEVVIPIKYYSVKPFAEGLGIANNQYIDKTGNVAITLANRDVVVFPFSGGFALIQRHSQFGYIDRSGKEVVPPIHTKATIDKTSVKQLIAQTEQILSPISVSEKWGYKNYKGDIVIPATFNIACDFSDDLALVESDGHWFYIHKDGSPATPYLAYDQTEKFADGYAQVRSGKLWGYIDKTGKEVVPLKYDLGVLNVMPVERLIQLAQEKNGTHSLTGPETLTPFQSAGTSKWGFINMQAEIIISPKYESATKFLEGLAKVKQNTKWGFIDSNDKLIIPCKYDDARDFCEGAAIIKRKGNWGFVDAKGKEIMLSNYYSWVKDFSEGLAEVVTNKKYGYVDKTGTEVVPVIYDQNTFSSTPRKLMLAKHRTKKESEQIPDHRA